MSCCTCHRVPVGLGGGLALAQKFAEVYLNASPVPAAAINILEHQGADPDLWEGKYYQGIEFTESFDTTDTDPPPDSPGAPWEKTTTITHTGDLYVNVEEDVDVTTVVTPDPDPPEDYVVDTDPNLDDSSVTLVGDPATHADLVAELTLQSAAQEWGAVGETFGSLGPLGPGWSGIWTGTDPAGEGLLYGNAVRIRWMPYILPDGWLGRGATASGVHPHPLLREGQLPLPLAVRRLTYEWDTGVTAEEMQKFQLPWHEYSVAGELRGIFAKHDPTNPNDEWDLLPFEEDFASGLDVIHPRGNLWPLFDGS